MNVGNRTDIRQAAVEESKCISWLTRYVKEGPVCNLRALSHGRRAVGSF